MCEVNRIKHNLTAVSSPPPSPPPVLLLHVLVVVVVVVVVLLLLLLLLLLFCSLCFFYTLQYLLLYQLLHFAVTSCTPSFCTLLWSKCHNICLSKTIKMFMSHTQKCRGFTCVGQ